MQLIRLSPPPLPSAPELTHLPLRTVSTPRFSKTPLVWDQTIHRVRCHRLPCRDPLRTTEPSISTSNLAPDTEPALPTCVSHLTRRVRRHCSAHEWTHSENRVLVLMRHTHAHRRRLQASRPNHRTCSQIRASWTAPSWSGLQARNTLAPCYFLHIPHVAQ